MGVASVHRSNLPRDVITFSFCVSVQDLKFTLAVTKMKGYFEAFFEQPPPFKLSLIEMNTDETVWSATIREGASRLLPHWLCFCAAASG